MADTRRNFPFVLTLYFFLGFYAIITQSVLLRELLVVVLGNEIVFGISLGHWLLAVFLGALLGGYVTGRLRQPELIFSLVIMIMCLLPPLLITLTRNLYGLSGTPAGTYIPFLKVSLFAGLLIFPFAFFIGFTFPLASRLAISRQPEPAPLPSKGRDVFQVAGVYIVESAGALAGGMVFSFLLAGKMSAYRLTGLTALPLLLLTAGLNFRKEGLSRKLVFFSALGLLLLNVVMITPIGLNRLDEITIRQRWQGFSGSRLVFSTDSRYQNIALGEMGGQFHLYTNGQLAEVFPEENDNLIEAAHLVCQHPAPKRILVIGDVLSGLGKFLLRYKIDELVSVEIDPLYLETIQSYLTPQYREVTADPRLSILLGDGRKLAKDMIRDASPPGGFHLVFIGLPEPATLLSNRYYTLEFFRDVAGILSPDGVLALQITSSENYISGIVSDYTVSIYNTLKKVFPVIVIAPGEANFFFCSRHSGIVTGSPEILARRYEDMKVSPRKLGLIFRSIYPRERTAFIKNSLERHPLRQINTDERPLSMFYYNKILGWTRSGKGGWIFEAAEKLNLKNILIFTAALLLLRLAWIIRQRRQKGNLFDSNLEILICVTVGGFAGMTLELLIIITFQNIFGYVYQFIGFLIALFMAGLPLGASLSRRMMRKKKSRPGKHILILMTIQCAVALISILFPHLIRIFSFGSVWSQVFLIALTIVIGSLIGAIFPLSLNLYMEKGRGIAQAAGRIDAADHLGAALGAFLGCSLLLPLLGLRHITSLLAIFSIVSSLMLLPRLISGGRQKGVSHG